MYSKFRVRKAQLFPDRPNRDRNRNRQAGKQRRWRPRSRLRTIEIDNTETRREE